MTRTYGLCGESYTGHVTEHAQRCKGDAGLRLDQLERGSFLISVDPDVHEILAALLVRIEWLESTVGSLDRQLQGPLS